MATSNVATLVVRLSAAGAAQASAALKQVGASAQTLGQRLKAAIAPAQLLKTAMASLAVYFSAVSVINFFRKTITGAMEAADVMARLQTSVANTGRSFEAWAPTIEGAMERLERLSTFERIELLNGLQRLIGITGTVRGSLANVGLAADIATQRQIPLAKAADLVGRAMNGQDRGLRNLGVSGKNAADLIAQLTQRFGGAGAQAVSTYAGRVKLLSNAWVEFREALGAAILSQGEMTTTMAQAGESVQRATQWIRENAQTIGKAAVGVAKLTLFLGLLAAALVNVATLVYQLGRALVFLIELLIKPLAYFGATLGAIVVGALADALLTLEPVLQRVGLGVVVRSLQWVRDRALAQRTAMNADLLATAKELRDAIIPPRSARAGGTGGAGGPGGRGGNGDAAAAAAAERQALQEQAGLLARVLALGQATTADRAEAAQVERKLTLALADGTLSLKERVSVLDALRTLRAAINPAERAGAAAEVNRTAALTEQVGLLTQLRDLGAETTADRMRAVAIEATLTQLLAAGTLSMQERVDALTSLDRLQRSGLGPSLDPMTATSSADARRPTVPTMPEPPSGEDEGGPLSGLLQWAGQSGGATVDAVVMTIGAKIAAGRGAIKAGFLTWAQAALDAAQEVDAAFAAIGQGIVDTLTSALTAVFSGGDPMKAVLSGLGDIFMRMGAALLKFGLVMLKLLPTLKNPLLSGPAALIAGAALIALGATLGGIARGGSGSAGGGNAGAVSAITNEQRITTVTLGGSTAQQGATVTPRTTVLAPVTVIGPDDPSAQRALVVLLQNAARRGLRVA